MNPIWRVCFAASLFVLSVGARRVHANEEDPKLKFHRDLTNFVSEPDIKAPLFNITHYDEGTVSPGYWFMDPYDHVTHHATTRAELFQVGAHIFDNHGELVWSGAPIFKNRIANDFKAVQVNGTLHLSFILDGTEGHQPTDLRGVGLIVDSHYRIEQNMYMPQDSPNFNMHEFNIIEDGRTALSITSVPVLGSIETLQYINHTTAWLSNEGFQETDLQTNKVLFNWKSLDHINISASKVQIDGGQSVEQPWDWFHLNSIDKNTDGDYLISARHTSTIYKISGRDGSILWQLGGINSSFVHEGGFNFSWQHDARFREENSTHTIISFLNNASNGQQLLATANTSSALYIALQTDISPMHAAIITKIDRPDGHQTFFRGNVQELPNDNIFICWSENGHISEFTPSGDLALEAKFISNRLSIYRAYKFEFTGLPFDPPVMKAYAFGTTADTITIVFYVSWNGATEVAYWQFYGNGIEGSEFLLVGSAKKTGFETIYMAAGYQTLVYAEGFDIEGNSLGRSMVAETIVPSGWDLAGCKTGLCQIPDVGAPLTRYIPDEEEHSGNANQAGSTSISKYGDEIHVARNALLRTLAVGGVLSLISLIVMLHQWWRARRAMLCNEYEETRMDEVSEHIVLLEVEEK